MNITIVLGWVTLALLVVLWQVADHFGHHSHNTYILGRSRVWAVVLMHFAAIALCACLIYTFGSILGSSIQTTITIVAAGGLLAKMSTHNVFDDVGKEPGRFYTRNSKA